MKGIATYSILPVIVLLLTLCICTFFTCYGWEYAPTYFALIPAFYLLDGLMLAFWAGKQPKEQRMSVKILMLKRLIRIVGSLVVLISGIVLDRTHTLAFVILFVVFYVVYLVVETIIMKNSQKPYKTKQEI